MSTNTKGSFYINKQNIGKTVYWHPWVGCIKVSEACKYCWASNSGGIKFNGYHTDWLHKISSGTVVLVTLKSDFFYPPADAYRTDAWKIIKEFSNLIFLIITKYPERIKEHLPIDWGEGYNNVILSVTAENTKRAVDRLNVFRTIPAKHKWVSVSPILEEINLSNFLAEDWLECVEVLGERSFSEKVTLEQIRECRYEWIKSLSEQCKKHNTRFSFLGAGHKFVYNNQIFTDISSCYHSKFADDFNLDIIKPIVFKLRDGDKII
jgi:protein gp37